MSTLSPIQRRGGRATETSRGDHSGFRRRFDHFDDDKDGVIPASKLGDLMEYLGYEMTDHQLEECVKTVDPEETGVIKFPDFVAMMERKVLEEGESKQEELYDTFCLLDEDDDGYISVGDLRVGMSVLGYIFDEEDLVEMIREADLDEDGLISYQEFMKAMIEA